MRHFLSILTLVLWISCSCKDDKEGLLAHFDEIKQLNQILIKSDSQLKWKNHPDSVAKIIDDSSDLLSKLKKEVDLTEIERHYIGGDRKKLGFAYRFGAPDTNDCYSFLIYSKNQDKLNEFAHYEQFSDCGSKFMIDRNWACSMIRLNCNN